MSMIARHARGLFLAAVFLSSVASAQGTPPVKQFFKPHAAMAAKVGGAVRVPGVVSDAVAVEFNAAEMLRLTPGDEVQLTLPNAVSHAVVFELAQAHGGEIHSWVGYLKGHGNDHRVILTTGPGGSFGVIDTPQGSYRIVPGAGHDSLVDMTQEQLHLPILNFGDDALLPPRSTTEPAFPKGQPSFSLAIPGVNRVGIGKATPELANIDLMVVVTKGLAGRLGAGLLTRLNFLVTRANTAYADSEIGINLRLVNVTVADYSDSTSDSTALNAITPGRSTFDSATFGAIEAIRSQVKADLVALLRNGSTFGGSGVAWVEGAPPNPAFLYSVTTGCVAGCESVFIHELGHNMGNMHDRATVAYQAGGTSAYRQGAQPYAYGYAFCKSGSLTCNPMLTNGTAGACPSGQQPECATNDPSNFSEIMAYFHGSTTRIYKFSNPAISCAASGGDGIARPCGIVETASGLDLATGSSNTALSMNTTRTGISAVYSGAANPPGIIRFTNTAFSGTESSRSVILSVSRSNGSGGAASVAYSFLGGTAFSGTDFTATSGSVSWADGDSSTKTITVPVTQDATIEGIEAFTATLSNATGGATLGWPISATGLIVESWPPGGTAPAGFSSSATPTLPWTVATDSFDGTADSVSFKSAAFSSSATGNSSTQFTGAFDRGTVAFAYRVSSYPGNGFFEFLVDNVVVVSDSGDSGWKYYSTTVSSGTHTLEWRYRKTLGFFCANATPAPPQGAACADRAWIDSVSLPLQGTVQQFPLSVTTSGTGTGTVSSSPAGINCGSACTANFLSGTPVTLSASASAGATFSGWSGGGCAGTGPCTITMSAATAVTASFAVSTNPPRLGNISTRGQVQTGDRVMIGGFVISGTARKRILVTARGPSLAAFGVTGALANPSLQLLSGQTVLASNDDWETGSGAADIQALGLAPTDSRESAILTTLDPGAYTAIVSGAGGATGVGIVEVFELDRPESPLVNISTRAQVQTGVSVMIGGFVIQGDSPRTVLITARGPSLAAFGVAGALGNPSMQLLSGQAVLASNDDWQTSTNASAIQATGLAPTNARESAILATLNPGAYTVIVSGVNSATGVGIVEVFAR